MKSEKQLRNEIDGLVDLNYSISKSAKMMDYAHDTETSEKVEEIHENNIRIKILKWVLEKSDD